MFARSRRMVPGMLASLLLAAPLFAAPALADGAVLTGPLKPTPEQRRAAPRLAQRHKPLLTRRRAPQAQMVAFLDDAPTAAGWRQVGIASWYGGARWQGHPTASGARYEQDALTAAHATLPLGSRVRVALAGSGRSVIVTINDRPGTRTRIIDLSRGAARALGILDQGIARVVLSAP